MHNYIFVNIVIVIIGCIYICPVNGGVCPKYPILTDFDFRTYTGLWYQQDKQQSGWEAPGRCWKSMYMRDSKSGQFRMRMIFSNTITGRVEQYDSQLTLGGPLRPSIIKYTIPLTFMEDQFQVLATDYETFAVEYKCLPNGILDKRESVYLLTREKNPSPLVLQRAYAIMHRYGIDIRKLKRVDQTCGGLDIVDYDYQDYDYYTSPPQEIAEDTNRRTQTQFGSESQQHSSAVYYDYDDGTLPLNKDIGQDSRAEYRPNGRPISSTRKRIATSYRRQQVPLFDQRLTLGQSLATRLWHVLHKPI